MRFEDEDGWSSDDCGSDDFANEEIRNRLLALFGVPLIPAVIALLISGSFGTFGIIYGVAWFCALVIWSFTGAGEGSWE